MYLQYLHPNQLKKSSLEKIEGLLINREQRTNKHNHAKSFTNPWNDRTREKPNEV